MGTAMLAFFMCVNLASCSKENTEGEGGENIENPEENGIALAGGKRLMKVESFNDNFTFEYDEKGRLTKAEYRERFNKDNISTTTITKKYAFVWRDNTIDVTEGDKITILNIKDGHVTTHEEYPLHENDETYGYSKGRLSTAYDSDRSDNYLWKGDTLMSIATSTPYERYCVLTYEKGQSCKAGYMPLIPDMMGFGCEAFFTAHPELVGVRTNILPDTYDSHEYGKLVYTYKFDEEGYITKIKEEQVDKKVTYTYTLTWE